MSRTATTPSTAQQITATSVLSQDFVTSNGVLVDTSRQGQVGVFRNPMKGGAIEALVLSDAAGMAQQLFYLAQDPTSLTGWTLTPLRDASGDLIAANEVITFADTWGGVDAYYIGTGGHLMHLWVDPSQATGWTAADFVSGAPTSLSQLRVAFSPGATASSGTLAVYAVDPTGTVYLALGAAGTWSGFTMGLGGAASSWTLALTSTSTWLLSMVAAEVFIFRPGGGAPLGGVHAGQTAWASGSITAGGLAVAGGDVGPANTAAKVLFNATNMAGTTTTMMVLLDGATDAQGGHALSWLVAPGTSGQAYGTVAQTSFVDGVVVESTDGFVQLYAVDPLMNLYAVRQVAFDAQDMASGFGSTQTFGPVFQLDTQIARLYADPSPSDAPALVAADAEIGALHLYYQDPTTTLWLAVPITLPTTASLEIDRWRTEVNVFDANGNPLPNTSVTVTAASALDLEVNGQYFVIDSVTPATITTNALGKATFSSLAVSLAPPALTFAAAGAPSLPVSPSGPVNAYLAGTGTLSGKPTFGASVVTQLSGNPNIDPTTAATAIQQCAQLGQAAGGDAAVRAAHTALVAAGKGVHAYTRAGGRHVMRACATRAEAQAFLDGARGASFTSFWEDVWDDAKRFAGDVWHAIKEGLHAVESVVVDLEKSVVSIIIQVGDAFVRLADWVITGIEDALQAVTSVFNWIEAKVDAVIDWLKALFDFQAIWNTKTVFVQQLQALPTYLAAQMNTWSGLADGFFQKQKATVDATFDALIQTYGTSQTFSGLSGWQPMGAPPNSTTPAAGSATPNDFGNNVNANWLQDKVSSNAPASLGSLPTSSNAALDAFLQSIIASGQDLLNAFQAFGSGVQQLLSAGSLASFEQIAIGTFLTIVKDLVDTLFDLADALVQGILALGIGAVDAFAAVMATPLELGFVNAVYAWLAGKVGGDTTMTMGDLLALLLAFPVTIVYKLVAGVDNEPFPGGVGPTGAQVLAARAGLGDGTGATIAQVFGTVAGTLTVIGGIWSFAGDAMQDPPSWLTYASIGTSVLHAAFTHPGWLQWTPLEWTTVAVVVANLLWLAPVLYFLFGAAIQTALDDLGGKIMGWLEKAGLKWAADDVKKAAESVLGLLQLVVSAVLIGLGSEPPIAATATIVDGVVAPFSFLTMSVIEDVPVLGEIALPLKLVLDVLGAVGGGVLEVVSAWTETSA